MCLHDLACLHKTSSYLSLLDYSLAREIFTVTVSELYIKEVSENES